MRRLSGRLTGDGWLILLCALVAVLLRIPFLRAPLTADEGGFLLVGGQWLSGDGSLYGAYWVDRPPLIIAIFSLADLLGGAVALRVIGCVAAAVVVLLAGRLGGMVGGGRVGVWCAVTAATFVTTTDFGAQQVSGEILAAPWVMAGLVTLLAARAAERGRGRAALMALGGVCASAAFLVKQNFVDVFVFAAVLFLADHLRLSRRRAGRQRPPLADRVRAVGADATAFASGAVVLLALVLAAAAYVGTSLAGLWEAVVLFRAEASQVISTSASSATGQRLARYPGVLLKSGALVLVAVVLLRLARAGGPGPLAWAGIALFVWEVVAVLGGGSYWMHYLVGLAPGLVLGTAVVLSRPDSLAVVGRVVVAYAAVVALLSTAGEVLDPPRLFPSQAAGRWLREHRVPGDTAVVAYGQPNILAEAGVQSPYSELWSLPVRVRDPQLRRLTDILESERRPVWLLVWRGELDSWGIDAGRARNALAVHYRPVADVCGYVVFLRNDVRRSSDDPRRPARFCRTGAA